MSWLGNFFTGNQSTSTSTTNTTSGTYSGVGQTTPSTLPYTTPTYHSPGLTSTYSPNPNTFITQGLSTGMPNYSTVHISGTNPILSTDKVKIDLNELGELIKVLKERFLIITPDFEKMEKYQALKKAYDHYKLIESMLGEESDNRS